MTILKIRGKYRCEPASPAHLQLIRPSLATLHRLPLTRPRRPLDAHTLRPGFHSGPDAQFLQRGVEECRREPSVRSYVVAGLRRLRLRKLSRCRIAMTERTLERA